MFSGARCHALRVRLAEAVRPEAPSAPGRSRLWVEDVPAGSAEPVAQRLREAEMSRATTGLRCTLVRYRDRVADLVLVADRGVLDAAGLRAVAAALTGAEPGEPAGTEVSAVAAAAVPDWASAADPVDAGSAELVLPLSEGGTEDSWRTALAITLVRYASVDSPGWAVIGTDRGAVRVTPGAPAEPTDDPAAAGLLVSDVDFGADEYRPCLAPPLPLTFSLWRQGDTVRLRCDHQAGRISPAQVGQFTRHLAHVHRQVLANPDVAVDAIELLDAAERERVAALGRPDQEVPSTPVRIDAAFRAVAARTPELVALTDGEVSLTYQELDERSDAVASGLRALGVSDGDRVGVCLERTAELVVTLLGVLKAGAAYVPTDPAYPAERLAYTAQNADLELVLTRLPELPGAASPVTPDEVIAAGTEPVTSSVSADDPAYVIYTSGSTGRPKGVVVPHRNVIALVDATRDEYALGSSDVWSLFHSSAFDVSVWEIFGCLLTGGRLVVVPYFVSREPEKFRDLLAAERVTVLSQTPSAFAQLLEVPHQDLVVRLVVFAGEPLDQRALLPWFDAHPELEARFPAESASTRSACRVVNMFGITETTVHSTHQTVTRRHALAGSRSVGPALPGWYLYVVDPSGRLQPPGVAGEIWVGGAGVTSGYLGQDDLTAQRFTEDPVRPGGRVYHSGDLGRLRPDGALEHLGRIDSQVKVRGFRIELDEIRAVLLENPDVRTAAVVVRRNDPDDAATVRLDAYVVLAAGSAGVPGATSSVRKRAAEILPDYMVPTSVTALDSLPLTTNGKLDAAKLPAPATPAAPVEAPADGDGLASRLREVWGSVLGVPVGLDDDFFELGGNSLFAVRIGARMREGGLPSLHLRELYRNPTIRSVLSALSA
ncbi:non-ribosomal peptide synthetase [Amycolatopsis saalfeldensis]|uniref:Amino acid adenylation domain-containing protein n=1 Tax=Amycolatopsis saalfeldensis TaxID=394193 RepID=A0A1H8XCD4_9PSEU|nr:non-ribosomal peptide synthetase [Amycolatopsis saalfeldensis]SEP37586.1 amino acid adenylation domain-containing protein [Amycolatopsis saalfeldensis]